VATRKFTEKQRRFVEEYLIDGNATRSAIAAGYSEKTARSAGCENLTKPNIMRAIMDGRKDRSERMEVDADWVLGKAVELHRTCMEKDTFNPSVAARALQIVGDHVDIQAFEKTLKVKHEKTVEDLSDDELDAFIIARATEGPKDPAGESSAGEGTASVH
jgi:phage terminase small subunit